MSNVRKSPILLAALLFCTNAAAGEHKPPAGTGIAEEPLVLGRARGMFTVGKCIYKDSLTDNKAFASHWHVQQKARNGRKPAVTVQKDGLHVLATGGTTIWLKKKLRDPLVITYTVRMDIDKMDREGLALQKEKGKAPSKYIVPSDVNCFWLADFPGDPRSVFNDTDRKSTRLNSSHYS